MYRGVQIKMDILTFNLFIYFWIEMKENWSYFNICVSLENILFHDLILQSWSGNTIPVISGVFISCSLSLETTECSDVFTSRSKTGFFLSILKLSVSRLDLNNSSGLVNTDSFWFVTIMSSAGPASSDFTGKEGEPWAGHLFVPHHSEGLLLA